LVTGSQEWPSPDIVAEALDSLLWLAKGSMTLVQGACKRGADAYAVAWGKQKINEGYSVVIESHPADWNGPKKRGAGFARNAEMVKLGADYCLAFIYNNSHGSSHAEKLARSSGIPTKTWRNVVGNNENHVLLEDARIVFRNFAGRGDVYNREGDRNFSVVLDDDLAGKMRRDGWNVKTKPPREEGDENFNHLAVKVFFKGRRPPTIYMITSRGRTKLDEEMCGLLDYADIKKVDMIIRPFDWKVNGDTGRKAYLVSLYVTINEDPLELKYADVPEVDEDQEMVDLSMDDVMSDLSMDED
jgi:hypothetical protein